MVKEAANNIGGWFFKNSWAIVVVVVSLIGGQIVTVAVQQREIEHVKNEISRVDHDGCKPSYVVRQKLPVLETKGSNYERDIVEIKADLKEIKSLLMGRAN